MYKQFYKDEEGHTVVYLAHTHLRVHPDFRLYLSTSVPLHIKGNLDENLNLQGLLDA